MTEIIAKGRNSIDFCIERDRDVVCFSVSDGPHEGGSIDLTWDELIRLRDALTNLIDRHDHVGRERE